MRAFSAWILSVRSLIVASSKLTFVIVVKSPEMTRSSVFSVTFASLQPTARARPINAPVSRSCPFATAGFFPHTPLTVQPEPPLVCSHWKQNIFSFMAFSLFVVMRRSIPFIRRTLGKNYYQLRES